MCAFCIPEAFAGRAPRAVFLNFPVSLCLLPVTLAAGPTRRSSILRTHFQVPYPVSPVFATLTKTAGGTPNNSHSDTRRSSLVTCTQLLSHHSVAHSFAHCKIQLFSFQTIAHSLRKTTRVGGMGTQRGEREIRHMRS